MRADMTTKISLLQPPTSRDSMGGIAGAWTVWKSGVWASKEPLLGNEYFGAEAAQSKVEVKFRTYYFAGVENNMRIRDSTGDYEILSAINVKNLNRELLMYCRKVK